MKALGRQILLELYECNHDILNNQEMIKEILVEASRRAQATIVTDTFHTFSPHGVSGVVVIAESHVAIHTWPEYGYAAVDVFTCGDTIEPWVIQQYLKEKLESKNVSSTEIRRGIFPDRPGLTHKPMTDEESVLASAVPAPRLTLV